jgi:undecaprenyl-diphosphatase
MDAMWMGIAQAFAIMPGVSRSGSTIAAGLFRDLDRGTAARFSFLMSTPIIAAAAAKDFWDLHKDGGVAPDMRSAFAVGIVVSGITGCFVIAFFLKYLKHSGLQPFVVYRVLFGIAVIALAMFRGFAG